jgi:hypothetical protein
MSLIADGIITDVMKVQTLKSRNGQNNRWWEAETKKRGLKPRFSIWCIRKDYSASPHPLGPSPAVTLSFLVPAAITALSVMTSSLTTLCNMVHPEGFEPSTARFVAEYSIQLSYGCTELLVR